MYYNPEEYHGEVYYIRLSEVKRGLYVYTDQTTITISHDLFD